VFDQAKKVLQVPPNFPTRVLRERERDREVDPEQNIVRTRNGSQGYLRIDAKGLHRRAGER